jgi:hypothetical protein
MILGPTQTGHVAPDKQAQAKPGCVNDLPE